jgi:hypothetical protein
LIGIKPKIENPDFVKAPTVQPSVFGFFPYMLPFANCSDEHISFTKAFANSPDTELFGIDVQALDFPKLQGRKNSC